MANYNVLEDRARKVTWKYNESIRYVKDVIAELMVQGYDVEAAAVETNVLVPMETELPNIIAAFSN